MGLFTLEGFAKPLTPIAEKLGLLPVDVIPTADAWSGDENERRRWQKTFPRAKGKRKTPGRSSTYAAPMRPCCVHSDWSGGMAKAVEYALWLAKRDGLKIKRAADHWRIFDAAKGGASDGGVFVTLRRFKRADGSIVAQAKSVYFGGIDQMIAIPHCGYDATLPAVEIFDAPETASCDLFANCEA